MGFTMPSLNKENKNGTNESSSKKTTRFVMPTIKEKEKVTNPEPEYYTDSHGEKYKSSRYTSNKTETVVAPAPVDYKEKNQQLQDFVLNEIGRMAKTPIQTENKGYTDTSVQTSKPLEPLQTPELEKLQEPSILDKFKEFIMSGMGSVTKDVIDNGISVKTDEEIYTDMNPYRAAAEKGVTQFLTGINNVPRATLNAIATHPKILEITNGKPLFDTPQLDELAQFGDKRLNDIQNLTQLKDIKEGSLQQRITDTISNVTNMVPSMLFGAATGLGLPAMAISAGGNSARQAENEGANAQQAFAYGAISGGIEAQTERLTKLVPFINKTGLLDKTIEKVLKPITNNTIKQLAKFGIGLGGEAIEEGIATGLDPVNKRITYDKNAPFASLKDYAESMIMGAALGGILGLPGTINDIYYGNDVDTAKKAQEIAQALPDNYISKSAKSVDDMTEDEKVSFIEQVKADITDYATNQLNQLAEQDEQEELQNQGAQNNVADIPLEGTQPISEPINNIFDGMGDNEILSSLSIANGMITNPDYKLLHPMEYKDVARNFEMLTQEATKRGILPQIQPQEQLQEQPQSPINEPINNIPISGQEISEQPTVNNAPQAPTTVQNINEDNYKGNNVSTPQNGTQKPTGGQANQYKKGMVLTDGLYNYDVIEDSDGDRVTILKQGSDISRRMSIARTFIDRDYKVVEDTKKQDNTPTYDITQTKHTKTGEPVWVVKLPNKIDKAEWEKINKEMTKLGGRYWSGNKGWNFKSDPTDKLKVNTSSSNDVTTTNEDNNKTEKPSKIKATDNSRTNLTSTAIIDAEKGTITVTVKSKNPNHELGSHRGGSYTFDLADWEKAENGFGNPHAHKSRLIEKLSNDNNLFYDGLSSHISNGLLDSQKWAIEKAYKQYLETKTKSTEDTTKKPNETKEASNEEDKEGIEKPKPFTYDMDYPIGTIMQNKKTGELGEIISWEGKNANVKLVDKNVTDVIDISNIRDEYEVFNPIYRQINRPSKHLNIDDVNTELANLIANDKTIYNAVKNSDKQNALIEIEKRLIYHAGQMVVKYAGTIADSYIRHINQFTEKNNISEHRINSIYDAMLTKVKQDEKQKDTQPNKPSVVDTPNKAIDTSEYEKEYPVGTIIKHKVRGHLYEVLRWEDGKAIITPPKDKDYQVDIDIKGLRDRYEIYNPNANAAPTKQSEPNEKTNLLKSENKEDTNNGNNDIIEAGGDINGENTLSTDENRNNLHETPKDVSTENVQDTRNEGGTGETRFPDTTGAKETNGESDVRRGADTGSSLGDNSTTDTNTPGTGSGEQHPGDRYNDVRINQSSNVKGNDYIINSQQDSIIDNGKKTRYKLNVEAIKLMKYLEEEGLQANAEQKKVLAKYVGWGGIPEVFTEEYNYNRLTRKSEKKPKDGWEDEYNELKSLLTEEEYRLANDTVLNAHYTSIDVIKGMYEGLRHFGFEGGRVLEPAVGIGNFIGSMPQDMRANVKVMTGIEIDIVTGKIAKLLYPNADIRVQGFEKSKLATGYYDVAISNVPFGKTTINDKKYANSITRAIHNYFFAKTLDIVRPGGLVMFITSSKTMDSKDTSGIRAYIKTKADLVGAIRLPNTAFKENAMTEVTTDIVILKVREPGTQYSGEDFLNMAVEEVTTKYGKTFAEINEYFVNHPENVLGELNYGKNMYAGDDVFVKGDGRDINKAIVEVMNKMPGNIIAKAATNHTGSKPSPKVVKDSSKGTKEGSYEVVNGKLTINKGGKLVEVVDRPLSTKEIKIISKLIEIKKVARDLLDNQRDNSPEIKIEGLRKQLNKIYDAFVKEYGYLNKKSNANLIADDTDINFILSLEEYTKAKRANKKLETPEIKESATKGEIFFKNTVSPTKAINKVQTAKEALIISLNEVGSVDIKKMSELTDKEEKEIVSELAGRIYKNPVTKVYETADEYLSGNVKAKLREAEAIAIIEPEYKSNVEALKKVQPKDKEAWQISLKLGSFLISEDVYKEFTKHLFGQNSDIIVRQFQNSGQWIVNESDKVKSRNSIKHLTRNTTTWGIDRTGFRGLDLLDKIMNNRSIIVNETYTDENGSKTKVNNPEATALAQERAEKIKQEFIEWLTNHNNGGTLAEIVQYYNDVYNTDVLREFDGSHLPDVLEGMNPNTYPNFKLAPHQKDAIWRIISSKLSTLLAHEVGAGKTFEMIAASMEMKRLGLIKKPMFCVPNNVYEQWGIEFRRLYTGAKILIPSKEQLEQKNRRIFMNKIATGDYDAIIVPESQFTMLPMSAETVESFYMERINEMEQAIELEIAENGKGSQTEKKITQTLKNLRTKMEKKLDSINRDEGNIDFEELGVDFLFVDEAHRFKNLMYTTRLQVSGLGNPKGSDKAFDLLMKTRYLQNLNGGKGVVFATATPLLNSIAEVYNWQQYLNPEQLHSRGIYSFDAWASIFAKIESVAEVKPEGTGYRVKNGISKITNIGQLAKMFREFTDFKTQEMLKLPRPDVKGGKYEVISIPGTKWLKDYMKNLSDRAEAVRAGRVKPDEDNMLKITTDGRKAALYPGLVNSTFEKEEGELTKIDVAVDHMFRQWDKTKEDRLTHLVFLEFSTPKAEKDKETDGEDEDGNVDTELDSVYQEFKRKLVEKGIPKNEIAFIHDAKTSDQKIALKNRFNSGDVRILIGNNEKMGVGIDLQKRTKTITHVDFPWRPKDLQQEDGRGLRQGNINKEIEMYVLVTEGSFDARLWDNLQRKSKLVDDMLTSDLDAVEIEDVGVQTLSAQEVVGIASGNPLMQEQIVVSQKVNKLRALEKGYRRDKRETQNTLAYVETILAQYETELKIATDMSKEIIDTTGDNFKISINGVDFTERKSAQEYLTKLENDNRDLIKQEGYEFNVDFAGVINRGKFIYNTYAKVTDSGFSNVDTIDTKFYADNYNYSRIATLTGIETSLRNYRKHIENVQNDIKKAKEEKAQLETELKKTFPYTEELQKLALREQELMRILNPEQVLSVAVEENDEEGGNESNRRVKSYALKDKAFTGRDQTLMPKGNDSGKYAKSVDDIISIIEKKIGVPIRTGKFRHKAHGIFKGQEEVIRTRIRNDLPIISHELGHYLDDVFKLDDIKFKEELTKLGQKTSLKSYTPKDVREEGVAEFVRLYLTDPKRVSIVAPKFLERFEKVVDSDTIKILSELRNNITAIVNLPAKEAIMNDVSEYEPRKSIVDQIGILKKIYNAWLDDSGPFQVTQKDAEEHGWEGENIADKVTRYRGLEAKALRMLSDKQRDLKGEIIGDSLETILRPISKKAIKYFKSELKNETSEERKAELQEYIDTLKNVKAAELRSDFVSYIISRRAMDYKDRGLIMPEPFYKYSDNISQMEEKYPFFVDVFDNLRKWEDNNLQLLVDAGIKTQKEIETIKEANANHVPLYRIKEAAEIFRGGLGKTLGQSKDVVKRIKKGSGATIIDPLESMIVDSFIIRRAAEANDILRLLIDMSEKGLGVYTETVSPGLKRTAFTLDEVKKQLTYIAEYQKDETLLKAIENMSEDTLESVVSIYRPLMRERDNEVTVYKNGGPHLVQVQSELYKAIKGLNRQQSHILIRMANVPKRILQFGAVTTIEFATKNIGRDTGTSLIQSEAGINPIDLIVGYARSFNKRDKHINDLLAHGGGTEFLNIGDRTQAQEIEDDILGYGVTDKLNRLVASIAEVKRNNNERTRSKVIQAAKSVLLEPVDIVQGIVGKTEIGARVAEYDKAIKKGYSKDESAVFARKLSQDFLRQGYRAREVNKIEAFFTAAIQGNLRIIETFRYHPFRTLWRGALYVTLPSMILYFFNHDDEDYQQLPEWRKTLFYNIPIGNGKFLFWPKPYGYGFIFGGIPELILDKMFHDDKETWDRTKEQFSAHFNIPFGISAVDPVYDVLANKSWANAPIEGKYDRENNPAYMIRGDKTSTLSKAIGDTIKNEKGLSPKQIDYLVQGYTGTLGKKIWRIPDTIQEKSKGINDITDIPVLSSFITDSVYSNDILTDLFNNSKEISIRIKQYEDEGEYRGRTDLPLEDMEYISKEFNSFTRKGLKDYNDQVEEIKENKKLTDKQKDGRLRQLKRYLNNQAKELNTMYSEFKDKYNLK